MISGIGGTEKPQEYCQLLYDEEILMRKSIAPILETWIS
jgi:hypothetical protein